MEPLTESVLAASPCGYVGEPSESAGLLDSKREDSDEEPESSLPSTLEGSHLQINLLSEAKRGLERTLCQRDEEIQRLRAQVPKTGPHVQVHSPVAASLQAGSSAFRLPVNPPTPTLETSSPLYRTSQELQGLKEAYASLMKEHEELHVRYNQAKETMFRCNQAEEEAKEKVAETEQSNTLLNEELALGRRRCDELSESCRTLRVTCSDVEAQIRELQEEQKQRISHEVAARCGEEIADCRKQHADDMLRLEERKQQLHMLVDEQKEKIAELEQSLAQRSTRQVWSSSMTIPSSEGRATDDGFAEDSNSIDTPASPSRDSPNPHLESRSLSLGSEDHRSKLFSQSLPGGSLQRPRSVPPGSNVLRGFPLLRSHSDGPGQPAASLRLKLQGLSSSVSDKLKEISSPKPNTIYESSTSHKPPPAIYCNSQLPHSENYSWAPHDGELTAMQFSSRGSYLATGGDRLVKLWEGSRDFSLHHVLKGCTQGIVQLDFDSEETCVLAASNDKSVQVWPLSTITTRGKHEVFNHGGKVSSAKFLNGDSSKVVSGSHDRHLRVWDVPNGKCCHSQKVDSTCVDLVSPYSNMSAPVITGHMNGNLHIWDPRLRSLSDAMAFGGRMNSLALAPDHQHVACLMNQREILIVDFRRSEAVFTLHAEGFRASRQSSRVVYSCDGKYVACGGPSLFIWSSETGKLVKSCSLDKGRLPMFSCAWYPSGSAFLTAHSNCVAVWQC